MLVTPLLEASQVAAMAGDQAQQQTVLAEARTRQQRLDDLQKEFTMSPFNPNQDPLEAALVRRDELTRKYGDAIMLATAAGTGGTSATTTLDAATVCKSAPLDTDGDGLCDAFETLIGTSITSADTDGDGLNDGIEVLQTGTDPKDIDSDGDGISDGVEVRGYTGLDGRKWYLNPLDMDSNHDGRPDGLECANFRNVTRNATTRANTFIAGRQNPTGTCEDTDGKPDVWDSDDDNDGVPDGVDLDPVGAMGRRDGSDLKGLANKTLSFDLTGQSSARPLLVEFQLRPDNPVHLGYFLNVLDWPSNDRDGQIQRVFDTTLGSSGKDANGEMRLIPTLEIEIPFQVGVAPPLPIKSGFNIATLTASTPVTAFVDTSKLDPFGISVKRKDASGTLLAYAPVNVVKDTIGSKPVAFTSTMYYATQGASFGPQNRARLVWSVMTKTDYCDTSSLSPTTTPEDYDRFCGDNAHWKENVSPTIVHTYYDDWILTGMSAREDWGAKAAIAFEDPDTVRARSGFSDSSYVEERLWLLANGLDTNYLGARGTSSTPDLNIDEFKHRFDKSSNAGVTDTQRWNIPSDTFRVNTYNFENYALMGAVPMTYTKQVLNSYFTSGSTPKITNPTLLFLREETFRGAGLSTTGPISGTATTVDLSTARAPAQTIVSMSWSPYEYRSGSGWTSANPSTYMNNLSTKLRSYVQADTRLNDDPDVVSGAVIVATSLYASLLNGVTRLAWLSGAPLTASYVKADSAQAVSYQLAVGIGKGSTSLAMEVAANVRPSVELKEYLKIMGAKNEGANFGKLTRTLKGKPAAVGDVNATIIVAGLITSAILQTGVAGSLGETVGQYM
jgi:hypothetical protein